MNYTIVTMIFASFTYVLIYSMKTVPVCSFNTRISSFFLFFFHFYARNFKHLITEVPDKGTLA